MARARDQRLLLHAGSFLSLEAALWRELRAVRAADPLAPVAVLVPTNLLRRHLTVAATAQGGQINVHFLTLIDLARQLGEPVLEATGRTPLPPFGGEVVARRVCRALGSDHGVPRPSSDLGVRASDQEDRERTLKRELERGTPGERGSYFAALAERPGFHRALLATIDDLKEAGRTPAHLGRALSRLGEREEGFQAKLRDLQALWSAYEARLAELRLYDAADLMAAAVRSAVRSAGFSPYSSEVRPEGRTTNGRRPEGRTTNGRRPEGRTTDGRRPEGRTTNDRDPWLASAAAVFVYGFYDLNELQRRLVAVAASAAASCAFFPWVPGSRAFEYAEATFAWFREQGFEPRAEPEPLLPPDLDALGRRLFEPPAAEPGDGGTRGEGRGTAGKDDIRHSSFVIRHSPSPSSPAPRPASLSLVSAPDEVREVREVLRACLAAARGGTPLPRVGILLRQRAAYAPLFAEECELGGLAAYHHGPPPLSATRAGRSLLMLLRILAEPGTGTDSAGETATSPSLKLARPDVMDFLTYADIPFCGFLPPGTPEPQPADWDLLTIEAGVVKGRESWQRQLAVLWRRLEAAQEDDEDDDAEEARAKLPPLAALTSFSSAFFDALEAVPRVGTWSELVDGLLGLFRRFVRESDEGREIAEAVAELRGLDGLGGRSDLAELARTVREVLADRRRRPPPFGSCGPVVVDLMEGRGLPFDVVFVPGLAEKGFPAPPREDPLLSDRERVRLARVGVRLPLKRERDKEERLLFRLAVGAGAQQAVLSYPRLDSASGRERVPSHFLLRVAEAVTGRRHDYKALADFPGLVRVSGSDFAPFEARAAWREAEYDLAAVQELLRAPAGTPAEWRGAEREIDVGFLAGLSPTFAAALHAEGQRWGERRFTAYDGVLASEAAREALRLRLGPMPWRVAPTQLERYAGCPFHYFLQDVLRVRPLDEPEAVKRLSGLDRGNLIHGILRRALLAAKREGRLPITPELEERLLADAREEFASFEQGGATGYPALWALERGSLEIDLRRFVVDEAEEGAGYVPQFFEVRFGRQRHESDEELGSDAGLLVDLGPAARVEITGRIDRIDLRPAPGPPREGEAPAEPLPGTKSGSAGASPSQDGSAGASPSQEASPSRQARVVDYKSGKKPDKLKPNQFLGGSALQLPLYLRAADALLRGRAGEGEAPAEPYRVEEAAYRFVTARGGYESVEFSRESLDARADDLAAILAAIIEGIGAGRFFACPADAPCRGCDYRVVCGAGAFAAARLKANDEAARAYLKMREIE